MHLIGLRSFMRYTPLFMVMCLAAPIALPFAQPKATATSSSASPTAQSVAEAKAMLKEHLKTLNQAYPFPLWIAALEKAHQGIEKLKPLAARRPVDINQATAFSRLEKEVQGLRDRRPDVQKLINEMYVQVVTFRIEERFKKNGKIFSPEARDAFVQQLKPYEAGSLQPKTAYLARLASIEKAFQDLRQAWMVAYAEEFLAKRIEDQLRSHDLQKNESLYDAYTLQLEYWRGQVKTHAGHSQIELKKMAEKWKKDRDLVQGILGKLTEALNTDMLYSDLLAAASKDGIEFPLEVESYLEEQLKSRQVELRNPIEQRKVAWNNFQADLKALMEKTELEAEGQHHQAVALAEEERREQERLAALKAEQEMHEREQREKFKQTLNALKTFTFKSETAVSLDDDATKALGTQTGFLKTSYVGTGKVKLKVGKEKFSDTLATVEKFNMAEGSIDLSKMTLEEKTNQSAYVYTSPNGRTSQQDLERFVNLVALGSFSTGYNFFSYVPSSAVRPGSSIRWKQDKSGDKAAQDRNFSYVDLVVDAHRVYHGAMKAGEKKSVVRSVNVPANMIIFFDNQGGIKRFISFADVSEVVVRHGDLTGGKLYYKFLNYSVDRVNIYLNGLDPEIKVAEVST
jgi:hypothetical protein